MNDTNKITIIGIVINAILFIASMAWAWFLNKKNIQAKLQSAQPAAKSKRKRKLTRKERGLIKEFRFLQLFYAFAITTVLLGDFAFSTYPPASTLDWISMTLTVGSVIFYVIAIIAFERYKIKPIRTGKFEAKARESSKLGK